MKILYVNEAIADSENNLIQSCRLLCFGLINLKSGDKKRWNSLEAIKQTKLNKIVLNGIKYSKLWATKNLSIKKLKKRKRRIVILSRVYEKGEKNKEQKTKQT